MTNEQAIEILELNYPTKKMIATGEYPDVAEAFDLAIQALEKQASKETSFFRNCKNCDECLNGYMSFCNKFNFNVEPEVDGCTFYEE